MFRGILLASWIVAIVGAVLSMVLASTLPEPLRSHVQHAFDTERPLTGRETAVMIAAIPLIVIGIWNLVELLRFRARARVVYCVLVGACLVITPLAGPFVEPGVTIAAYYAAGLLFGGAIAAMWWSPTVAAKFAAHDNVA